MPESVTIPVDLLAETQAALDAALSMERDAFGPAGKLAQVRAKLTEVAGSSCANIGGDKRQEGYQLLRHLDEVRRKVKKDYGLEK